MCRILKGKADIEVVKKNFFIIILLFAACAVCYGSVSNAGFVWDDEYIVRLNPLIRAPLLSFQIFKQDIINSGFTYTIYYRPVQILSYALDYRMWGLDPAGFHLTSVVLHFLNAILVFVFTMKLSEDKSVSFLTALFFVISPIHAGAVSYISSRTDLLFFLFGFLFMLFYVLFVERKRTFMLWASIGFLVLSLLSKEAALIFPFLMLLIDLTVLRKRYGFSFLRHIPNLIVCLSYAVIHRVYFSTGHITVFKPAVFFENIARNAGMIGESLALVVFPSEMYLRRVGMIFDGRYLVFGAIGVLILILYVLMRDNRRLLLMATGFYVVSLLPFISVAGYFKVFGEHWVYLSSYGVFLFMALTLLFLYRNGRLAGRILAVCLVLGAVVSYSAATRSQTFYWQEDEAFSDRVLAFSGKDKPAMHYKAVSSLKSGDKDSSRDIMDEYVKNDPDNPQSWYIKGRLALASGRTEEAVSDFKKSLQLDRAYDNGYLGLAFAAFMSGDQAEGVGYLQRVLQINPKHSEALLILSQAYSKGDDPERALVFASKAIAENPYGYDALINLGSVYTRAGELQAGAKVYLEATRLYPEMPRAYYDLGYAFLLGGQILESEKWVIRALEADPSFVPAIELLRDIRSKS
ncbi:MAG: tetratricopeptide repeat protein [Candidatus Tantalella remota]|nr:tetratricopeptide repeat protein [Candidatus Tantalella remota]